MHLSVVDVKNVSNSNFCEFYWVVGVTGNTTFFGLPILLICASQTTGFKPVAEIHHTCTDLDTPSRLPYCDMVSPTLGILVGGNSWGATIAEEVGRMGADMIVGKSNWNLDIPKEVFMAKYVK